jgi:Bacterial membrane protein YfhO
MLGNKASHKFLSDLFCVCVLLAAIHRFAREMVWDGKVPFFRDLGTYSYPLLYSLAEAFRAHELPLWNRHAGMGFPLLADFQSGTFYPPHLLLLVFPFFSAIQFLFILHYVIAAVGAYVLCRHWRYCPALALLGALLFTFGGIMVSLTNLLNHFQTAVWLPWSVYLWESFLRQTSWKSFVLLSFVLLIQLFGGSPEIYILSAGLLLCDGIAIAYSEGRRRYARPLCLLLVVNITVALLIMVQLLPTIELIVQSRRQEPIPYGEAVNWSLRPLNLLNLIFLDKEVSTKIAVGAQPFLGLGIPFFLSYYMGSIALFSICLWLLLSTTKEKIFLSILIIASTILALGMFTPIYPFLYRHIPLFGTLRYPEKFFFFTYALLLYVILRGLGEFFNSESSRSNKAFLFLALMMALIIVFYVFLRASPESLLAFVIRSVGLAIPPQITFASTASVLVNLERQMALWVGLLLLLFAAKKGYLRNWLANVLIVATVFVDLSSAHQSYQYLLKPDFIFRDPRILQHPDPEPNRVFYYPAGPNLHPNTFVLQRKPTFQEVYSVLFANLFPNTGTVYGFDYMQDINALATESYVRFLRFANSIDADKLFRLLGALNVRYVTSFQSLNYSGITLQHYFPQYPSWLYRIDRVVPRAYIVNRAAVETDSGKILERLSDNHFDPAREVLLSEPVSLPGRTDFAGEAKILTYANQRVLIQATLNNSGVLILSDSFYPGWHAYIDGKEEKILRANWFFRAISLSEGKHAVEFRYEPRSFTIGFAISLATLAALIVTSIVLYVRERRTITYAGFLTANTETRGTPAMPTDR